MVEINGFYQLNYPKDTWNDKISYVNRVISPKYTWVKEINGKKVKVKSLTKLVTEFYIVTLVKDYNGSFYVPKKYLIDCSIIKCECDSYMLFWCGCKCGAFQQEKLLY